MQKQNMKTPSVKYDLIDIANNISDSATYIDAMNELYIRMKIAQGRQAIREGRILSHEQVKRKFNDQ